MHFFPAFTDTSYWIPAVAHCYCIRCRN